MYKKIVLVLSTIIFVAVLSCTTKWQDPETAVPHQKLPITAILINPHAYDSSGVEVEGMIWDLGYDMYTEEDVEIPFTSFKLADSDGNYIRVYAEGNYPLTDGEQIQVTGIYRRAYITESRNFVNEIVAKEIKLGRTSTLYRVYQYIK